MKKIFLSLFFVLAFVTGFSQYWYQINNNTSYKNLRATTTLGLPRDTTAIDWNSVAGINGVVYLKDSVVGYWVPVSGLGSTDGNNYTTSKSFLSGVLTTSRNGLPDLTTDMNGWWVKYGDTAGMFSGYTRLQRFLDSIYTLRSLFTTQYQRALSFTSGLAKLNDTTVYALTDAALWNARKIQGYDVPAYVPVDGGILRFNGAANNWEFDSVGVGLTSESDPVWLAEKADYATIVALNNFYTKAQTDSAIAANLGGGVGISDGDKGDITVSGSGTVWEVDSLLFTTTARTNHVIDSLVALMQQYKTITSFNSDTTNKWVQDVYARNDSLFKYKNGTETFIDSVGGSGGEGSGTTINPGNDFTLTDDTLKNANWVNVKDFGAVGDGVTNDLDAFTAAVATGQNVFVPDGDFLINGTAGAAPFVTLSPRQRLFGTGYGSHLKTTVHGRILGLTVGNEVDHIFFEGDNSKYTTEEFQTAIYIGSNDTLNIVRNNWFYGFGGDAALNGGAVVVGTIAVNAQSGNIITENVFENNHYSVVMDGRGEYTSVVNNIITETKIGIYNAGGNNRVIGNNIIWADTAYKLYGGTNNAHCVSTGNTYNHNTFNLVVSDVTNGHTFNGDMFYAGNVDIRNSTGIRFTGSDFSTGTITLTNNSSLYRSGRWTSMTKSLVSGEDFNVLGEEKTGTTATAWIKQTNTDSISFKGPIYHTGVTPASSSSSDSVWVKDASSNQWKLRAQSDISASSGIETVEYDSLAIGDVWINSSLNRLAYRSDSFYYHIAITDSVRYIYPDATYDEDANLFFSEVEGTGATISDPHKEAISTFYTELKSEGLYTKIYDAGLFIGGTAAAHSKTMKGLNDITWSGTITHDANGMQGDGSTGYGNTGIVPSTDMTLTSQFIAIYSRTNTADPDADIGAQVSTTQTTRLITRHASVGMNSYLNTTIDGSGMVRYPEAGSSAGLILGSRTSSTDHRLYYNGSQVDATSTTANTGTLPNIAITIGGMNDNGTVSTFTPRQFCFFAVGTGLTSGEVATFYTLVENLQDALGRGQ